MIDLLTYKAWLLKFIDVDLPIGDIAKDVALDKDFPNTKDYDSIYEYLTTAGSADSFMRVFEYSYKMYNESTQK